MSSFVYRLLIRKRPLNNWMGKSKNYHFDSHTYSVSSTQTWCIMYSLANELCLKSSSLRKFRGLELLVPNTEMTETSFYICTAQGMLQLQMGKDYFQPLLWTLFSRSVGSPRYFTYMLMWRCLHISLFYRNQELVLCFHSAIRPLPQQSSNALLASSFITSLKTDALRIACLYSWYYLPHFQA